MENPFQVVMVPLSQKLKSIGTFSLWSMLSLSISQISIKQSAKCKISNYTDKEIPMHVFCHLHVLAHMYIQNILIGPVSTVL